MKKDDNKKCISCGEELTSLEVDLEFEECSSCLDNKYSSEDEYDITKDNSLDDILWS